MQSNSRWLDILKTIVFASIGIGILYLLYRSQQAEYMTYCAENGVSDEDCSLLDKIWQDFRSVNYLWIGVVLICYIISNISRAIRWQMLIQPLGHQVRFGNAFFTIMLGYFTNLGIPRLGEFVRAATMSRYEKIPVEKLMGTVVVDRIFDAVTMLTMIGVALLLEFDTLWSYFTANFDGAAKLNSLTNTYLLWLLMGLGILFFFVVYFFRAFWMSTQLGQRLIGMIKGFLEGIQSIRGIDRPVWFVAHSINIWFMYFLMTYLAFFAFEPTAQLSAITGLMTFLFGAFGIVLPSPGGVGAYQFFVQECLTIYGIEGTDAFSFANILFFSIQIGANVLLGLVALVMLPLLNRK
jgi:uncharacterized protein (TIRG00374 family)